MDEEELDKEVEEYRRFKRCTGHCDRILPNSDEFFGTDLRKDRGGRRYTRGKCRTCTQDEKSEAGQIANCETAKDPGYEMSFEEIGKVLGISRQRVDVIYNQAIAKLRRAMKRNMLS